MKKCPFCAEDIQDEAVKCKHCGSMLNQPNPTPKVSSPASSRGTALKLGGALMTVAGAFGVFVGYGMREKSPDIWEIALKMGAPMVLFGVTLFIIGRFQD